MCWKAKHIWDWIPRRAKKDIEIYKIVFGKNTAPIWNYDYSIDQEEPEIILSLDILRREINEGYHAFSSKCGIKKCEHGYVIYSCDKGKLRSFSCNNFENIRKAIIPKGSIYFINGFGEIVSNRIIVTSKTIEKK